MAEGFVVRPEYVGGFSNLLSSVSSDIGTIKDFLYERTHPDRNFGTGGVIWNKGIRRAHHDFWNANNHKLVQYNNVSVATAGELAATAWQYWQAEDEAHRQLTPGQTDGLPFDGSVPYPRRFDPRAELAGTPSSALPSPDSVYDPVRGLVAALDWLLEAMGHGNYTLGDSLFENLMGDWRILDNIGHSLVRAGNALSYCDRELQAGLDALDPHWNGGAAQAFTEYMGRLTHGLRDQGAALRVSGEICRSGAVALYELLAEIVRVVEDELQKLGLELGTSMVVSVRLLLAGKAKFNMIGNALKAISLVTSPVIREYAHVIGAVLEARMAVQSYLTNIDTAPQDVAGALREVLDLYRTFTDELPGLADAAGIAAAALSGPDLAELTETPRGMTDAPAEPYEAGLTPEDRSRPGG